MSILFSFSGKIDEKNIYKNNNIYISEKNLLESLKEDSESVSCQIKQKISEKTGLSCDVVIYFKSGCIEWFGYIEIAKDIALGIATTTGVLQFLPTVKKTIDSVVERNLVKSIYGNKRKRELLLDKERIEPTFEIETKITNVTNINELQTNVTNINELQTNEKNHCLYGEKNINNIQPIIYIVLALSIVANIVGFVALALSLVSGN